MKNGYNTANQLTTRSLNDEYEASASHGDSSRHPVVHHGCGDDAGTPGQVVQKIAVLAGSVIGSHWASRQCTTPLLGATSVFHVPTLSCVTIPPPLILTHVPAGSRPHCLLCSKTSCRAAQCSGTETIDPNSLYDQFRDTNGTATCCVPKLTCRDDAQCKFGMIVDPNSNATFDQFRDVNGFDTCCVSRLSCSEARCGDAQPVNLAIDGIFNQVLDVNGVDPAVLQSTNVVSTPNATTHTPWIRTATRP